LFVVVYASSDADAPPQDGKPPGILRVNTDENLIRGYNTGIKKNYFQNHCKGTFTYNFHHFYLPWCSGTKNSGGSQAHSNMVTEEELLILPTSLYRLSQIPSLYG